MTARRVATLVAAAAGAAAVGLVAPEVYSGTFSDLGTFLRALLLVVALVAWVVVVRRVVAHRVAGPILAVVPVVIVAWVVLWPYLRPPTEVDEAFPPVTAAPTVTTTPAPTTVPSTTLPSTTLPSTPRSSTAVTPSSTTTTTSTTTTSTTTTVAAEPVELARGGFQGLTGHRGSGDAAVYRLADTSVLLRLEEVDIGSGPRLNVYLAEGADVRGPGGATFVAPLTAERGNQNYAVPDDVDLTTGTWTVLVWCETFAVEVANATLTL